MVITSTEIQRTFILADLFWVPLLFTFLLKNMLNWELKKVSELSVLKMNINETWLAFVCPIAFRLLPCTWHFNFWHVTNGMQSKGLVCRQWRFLRYLRNACLAKFGGFFNWTTYYKYFESINNLITWRGKAKLVQSQHRTLCNNPSMWTVLWVELQFCKRKR